MTVDGAHGASLSRQGDWVTGAKTAVGVVSPQLGRPVEAGLLRGATPEGGSMKRLRMGYSPPAGLARSLLVGATDATDETNRVNRAAAWLGSCWRRVFLNVCAFGVFLALTVFVLVRPADRPAHAEPGAAKGRPRGVVSTPPRVQNLRATTAAVLPSRAQTRVLVLNGNGISGAAAAAASALRARGYTITTAADASRQDYPQSLAMYTPGFAREAKRLAGDLNVSTLLPLDPLAVPVSGRAQLIVIIGRANAHGRVQP